jgi:hypothetical protein
MLKACYKLGNLLKAEVNIGKISESANKYGKIACMHLEASRSPRKLDNFFSCLFQILCRLFPALWPLTTLDILR